MVRFWMLLGAVSLAIPGVALGQGISMKPDDIIMARQGGMAAVGGVTEAMKAGVASGADVKAFAEGAEGIAKWGKAYPALYPDGTQTGMNTKAKPEIWSDRAGFEKANVAMVAAAEKLAELAKAGDKPGFATQFTALGQSCGGCHRNYKAR